MYSTIVSIKDGGSGLSGKVLIIELASGTELRLPESKEIAIRSFMGIRKNKIVKDLISLEDDEKRADFAME